MLVEQSIRNFLAQGAESGTLGPGSKLPTERASWTSSRPAFRRAPRPGRPGTRGSDHPPRRTRHIPDRGRHAQVDGAPADTSPAEIMQVRLLLEPQVAALAARVATQADIDRITACLDAGGHSHDYEGFEAWDARLHRAIAESAHNGLLMNMFDVLNTARALPVWGTLKRRAFTADRRACYHREHTAIVDALRDRDPDRRKPR